MLSIEAPKNSQGLKYPSFVTIPISKLEILCNLAGIKSLPSPPAINVKSIVDSTVGKNIIPLSVGLALLIT
jgi:hypothetical protein